MSLILSACGLWPASGATFGKEETLPKTKERERVRERDIEKIKQGSMSRKKEQWEGRYDGQRGKKSMRKGKEQQLQKILD